MLDKAEAKTQAFRLEEATIDDLHAAILSGAITVAEVVQRYLARVRAYNGVASMLVTQDGAPVAEAPGVTRADKALKFPTQTVKAATILPDLDNYIGPPLEFGRMEATAPNPKVQQQFGMIVGVPNAGQLNALGTLNLRGERSVTCWGEFDKHPSLGPLPPGAPPVCELFRQQPDALERAAELDEIYGGTPDLETMPMYGVMFSFKDSFDAKDMRSTGGGDAAYDIDFPARDHVLVEQLRSKGAIIFAKAVNTEYNGRAGDPGGRHKPDKVPPSTLGYQRSTWAGNPANPYDTTRSASLGSSSGSGVSVSANLVMASPGEETRASCRGPSNHNAIALILPHKAMLGFNGGAIGADIYCDRSGIHARTIDDCAKILDALKDPVDGYYDPRWIADSDIEQMKTDYRKALARLVPVFMPDLLFRLTTEGTPVFPDFAAAIVPTEFAPGKVFGSGVMQPIDYCVEMEAGRIAPPRNLDLGTIQRQAMANAFRFHISQYLSQRAGDWKARGFNESLADWVQLNARSKYWGDDQRAAFKNWEEVADPRNPVGQRQGVNERIMLRELLRRADMMVILENKLDALVRLHTPWPPGLTGHTYQYDIASNLRPESLSGPNADLTEVLIPAGYVTTVYDPVFQLTPDCKRYVSKASDQPTTVPAPGLPFSLVFRARARPGGCTATDRVSL
jgi:hypothetical protein